MIYVRYQNVVKKFVSKYLFPINKPACQHFLKFTFNETSSHPVSIVYGKPFLRKSLSVYYHILLKMNIKIF